MEEREQAVQFIHHLFGAVDALLNSDWAKFGLMFSPLVRMLDADQVSIHALCQQAVHPETIALIAVERLAMATGRIGSDRSIVEEHVRATLTSWRLTAPEDFWSACIETWDANFKPKQEESATD